MYARIEDDKVVEFPYTVDQLKSAHPSTSFPAQLSDAVLAGFGVVRVVVTGAPAHDERQKAVEGLPVREGGRWVTGWQIVDLTADELAARRAEAYRNEADPLFFKAQRGEASLDQWRAKVDEIRARYA